MTWLGVAVWSGAQPKERWLPCHRTNPCGGAAILSGVDGQHSSRP